MVTREESSQSEPRRLTVTVKSQTATRAIRFSVGKTCRLYKLLMSYCDEQNLDYKTMRFLYEGKRISAKHTPRSLGMKDGVDNEIDAMSESDGGGGGGGGARC